MKFMIGSVPDISDLIIKSWHWSNEAFFINTYLPFKEIRKQLCQKFPKSPD